MPPPIDDDHDDYEDEYWNSTDIDDQENLKTHIQYIYKKRD
jgi:hypothetical protein